MFVEVVSVESVIEGYRRLMRALRYDVAGPAADPWSACPMTLPQLRALSLIATSERGLSSRELATSLGVGASAITPLVDRLVEHGFAQRSEDPHDRRIARLQPTDAGVAMLERMRTGQTDVLRTALAQLDPAELALVGAALDVLGTGLRRAAVQLPRGTTI